MDASREKLGANDIIYSSGVFSLAIKSAISLDESCHLHSLGDSTTYYSISKAMSVTKAR